MEIERTTKETAIKIRVDLDGSGEYDVNTGIGFFDHMLSQLSRHSLIDMTVQAKGDLHVDGHHTVEDVGLAIGTAIGKALGDKAGITRYANAFVPMDEVLAQATVDISGRPFLVFNTPELEGDIGGMDWEMNEEFFRALAFKAGITLHINVQYGSNKHHVCEAVFKAVARALRQAVALDAKQKGIPSTKRRIINRRKRKNDYSPGGGFKRRPLRPPPAGQHGSGDRIRRSLENGAQMAGSGRKSPASCRSQRGFFRERREP